MAPQIKQKCVGHGQMPVVIHVSDSDNIDVHFASTYACSTMAAISPELRTRNQLQIAAIEGLTAR